MSSLPYIIFGNVDDSAGSNVVGAKVVVRDDRDGQTLNTTTDSSGNYAFDLSNLSSGYDTDDQVTVICASGLESAESSILISSNTHQIDLDLAEEAESADLTYCQIQDVLDELGDKSLSDITYSRLRKIILRSEAEIDDRAGTTFKVTAVTDEILHFDQYTGWKSPEQLRAVGTGLLVGSRNDYWSTNMNDRLKLENSPVLTVFTQLNGATSASAQTLNVDSTSNFPSSGTLFIYNATNGTEAITYTGKTSTTFTGCTRATNGTTATAHGDNSYVTMVSLARNENGMTSADSWTSLQPQVGGGGSFIIDASTGILTFVDNLPALGFRKIKASYSYGKVSVPKVVEKLCILLSARDVLMSKSTGSQFDSINSIRLESISITSGVGSSVSYFNWLVSEINRLWDIVGEMKGITGA